jgi:two-component system sensor kinase FixL
VIDQGIGIPEKDIENIFERFFRANNAINIQGTGLGLNIVKRYVELMAGDINFTSKEGSGTEFKVTIPINVNE